MGPYFGASSASPSIGWAVSMSKRLPTNMWPGGRGIASKYDASSMACLLPALSRQRQSAAGGTSVQAERGCHDGDYGELQGREGAAALSSSHDGGIAALWLCGRPLLLAPDRQGVHGAGVSPFSLELHRQVRRRPAQYCPAARRYDKLVLLNYGTVLAWRAKVAWAHDWVTDPSVMPVFEALPGASFIVNGATPAKNSALTSAGAELRLINGVSLLAKFDGEFAAHSQTYAGTGTVRYVW